MEFKPVAYMEWAKLGSHAALNLGRSGMSNLKLEDIGLTLEGLKIGGEHAYGYPPLLEAIAARYGAVPDQVVPAIGTSQAIFSVCAALLDRGDTVLVEKPAYEPLRACAEFVGAEMVRFSRTFENAFQPDLDEFRSRLAQKPKLVLLTNIHNPSGVLISRQTLLEVAQAAQRVGTWLCVDEVYLEYLSGEESRTAFGLADNIIVISSLTKVFGLGGLRCGWILAPNPLVPVLRRAMDHLFVEHVYIAEQLAARIFPKLDAIKEKNRARIAGNRETVERFMLGESVLAWIDPAPGGIICFPRLNSSLGGDGLAKVLMDRHSTVVVPGSFFEDAGHFRLGFGVKPEVLAKGLANIRNAIQEK